MVETLIYNISATNLINYPNQNNHHQQHQQPPHHHQYPYQQHPYNNQHHPRFEMPEDNLSSKDFENPFRPDGELSREAESIVNLIKEGKPLTPTSPTKDLIGFNGSTLFANGSMLANGTNGIKSSPVSDTVDGRGDGGGRGGGGGGGTLLNNKMINGNGKNLVNETSPTRTESKMNALNAMICQTNSDKKPMTRDASPSMNGSSMKSTNNVIEVKRGLIDPSSDPNPQQVEQIVIKKKKKMCCAIQ